MTDEKTNTNSFEPLRMLVFFNLGLLMTLYIASETNILAIVVCTYTAINHAVMSIRFKSLAYFFYTLGGIVLGVLLTVFVGVMKDTDTYIEMTQILMPIYIYVLTFAFKYISLYIAERKPTIFHTT